MLPLDAAGQSSALNLSAYLALGGDASGGGASLLLQQNSAALGLPTPPQQQLQQQQPHEGAAGSAGALSPSGMPAADVQAAMPLPSTSGGAGDGSQGSGGAGAAAAAGSMASFLQSSIAPGGLLYGGGGLTGAARAMLCIYDVEVV